MKIDWKLKGFNLLKFNCNKEQVIHPETCSDMVQMGHDGSISFTEWLTTGGETPFDICDNLASWITTNLGSSLDITVDTSWTPNTEDLGTLTGANSISLGYIANNSSNPIRVPFADINGGVASYGLVKAGTGLQVSTGLLSLKNATSSAIGGVRVASPSDTETFGDSYRVVRFGNTGVAYVDISNINANTYLYNWFAGESSVSDEKIPSVFYVKDPENDPNGWESTVLSELFDDNANYDQYFLNLYKTTAPDTVKEKIYPIRAAQNGRLYTYVDWVSNDFVGSTHGLVPSGTGVTNPTTKFLNASGEWRVPYSTFTTSVNGLVPASGANTTSFLRGDGTWATPTDTTYEYAKEDNEEGLLRVSSQIPDTTGCTMVESIESPTTTLPIRLDADEKIHVVVIDDIVEAIKNNSEFIEKIATTIAGAIQDNEDLKQIWQTALGIEAQ